MVKHDIKTVHIADIKNIFNHTPSQNILNFVKMSTYMINYNF